jgi:carbamoylphosphate synthase small subunit
MPARTETGRQPSDTFLFFETAFGICLGCQIYALIYREKAQYCPGEVCERGAHQQIQQTSGAQVLIAVGFVAYIVLVAVLFTDSFGVRPHNLFGR